MANDPIITGFTNQAQPAKPRRTFLAGAWGNQGNDIDANGQDIAGTSGASVDADRYRKMGQGFAQPYAPQIDQTRPNESRAIGMGSLGLLRSRAEGGMTPAQQLAQQQTQGAVSAVQSGAAGIKGGPMARAAAARNAQNVGARVQAQGAQDQQALRAREMADGAGQLFGASTAQRGADLGLAGEQAKLEAQHRAATDQREGFYEGLNTDTKKAELDHLLGRTASEQAALNASNATNNAAEAARQATLDRAISAGTGAAIGGLNAYGNVTNSGGSPAAPAPGPSPVPARAGGGIDRNNPYEDPWSSSDPKAKTNVVPLYEDRDSGMERHWDADVSTARPDVTSGASLSAPTPKYSSAAAKSEPKPAPLTPKARVRERAHRVSDDDLMRQAEAMLGGVETQRDAHLGRGAAVRDTATSDPRAKREAFIEGVNHTQQMHDTGVAVKPPSYVTEAAKAGPDRHVTSGDRGLQASSSSQKRTAPQRTETHEEDDGQGRRGAVALAQGAAMGGIAGPLGAGYMAGGGGLLLDHVRNEPDQQVGDDSGEPYFGSPRSMAARVMPSDPKTKTHVHDSPMADANRSMVASSYEYRPEFTPPEQRLGEQNIGPMADKMKANPVAGTAIVRDPESGMLAIDKTKGLKLVMGGLSDVQRQIDEMKRARR